MSLSTALISGLWVAMIVDLIMIGMDRLAQRKQVQRAQIIRRLEEVTRPGNFPNQGRKESAENDLSAGRRLSTEPSREVSALWRAA